MDLSNFYEQKYENIIREKLIKLCINKRCLIFLFGSRACNTNYKGSDFDVGILGLSDKEFYSVSSKFDEFLEESIVPYNVDLINFNTVSPNFKKKALETIITWKTD